MKLRRYEIVCDINHITEETLKNAVMNEAVSKYAFILHDKDIKEDGTQKTPHYHILIWLKYSCDSKYVCSWFKIPENFVGKIRFDHTALEYLTHMNAPEKHQYEASEVVSSFDIQEVIKAGRTALEKDEKLNDIITKICEGEIGSFEITNYVSPTEYVKWEKKIKTAFEYRRKKLMFETKGERNMKCFFLTGDSGTGKTTFAKQYCNDNHLSFFVSSGSNDPLDGYDGQDVIILDDLRPSVYGLSDLLKLLDNNTASTVKSRFYNKFIKCSHIFITTTLSIDSFFSNVFSEEPETSVQLKRRCESLMDFHFDYIECYIYDKKKRDYVHAGQIENIFTFNLPEKVLTEEDAFDLAANMLGNMSNLLKNTKDVYLSNKEIDKKEMPADEFKEVYKKAIELGWIKEEENHV